MIQDTRPWRDSTIPGAMGDPAGRSGSTCSIEGAPSSRAALRFPYANTTLAECGETTSHPAQRVTH